MGGEGDECQCGSSEVMGTGLHTKEVRHSQRYHFPWERASQLYFRLFFLPPGCISLPRGESAVLRGSYPKLTVPTILLSVGAVDER